MELTPPVAYRMSLTAAEVEELLLSIYTKIPTDTIRTSLDSPDDLTIPTTKAVADAIAIINADLEQLGDLALLDSLDLGSTRATGILPIGKGGTGANTVEQAQLNLGIVVESAIQTMIDASIPAIQSVDLGSSQATGVLPLSKGGTGATGSSQARANLQVWSSSQSEALALNTFAALKRSYAEAGYTLVPGSFEDGGVVSTASEVLLYKADGHAYGWTGTIPVGGKVVPIGSTPATAGGVGPGLWLDREGVILRNQLSASNGSSNVGFQQAEIGSVPRTILEKSKDIRSTPDYGAMGDGVADDSAAFLVMSALAGSTPIDGLGRVYLVSAIPTSGIFFNGMWKVGSTLTPFEYVNFIRAGNNVVTIGRGAAPNCISDDFIAIGNGAAAAAVEARNGIAIGKNSMMSNRWARHNLAFGLEALRSVVGSPTDQIVGSRNIGMGGNAGRFLTGSRNLIFGRDAGHNLTDAHLNLIMGIAAVMGDGPNTLDPGVIENQTPLTPSYSIMLGAETGKYWNAGYGVGVGYQALMNVKSDTGIVGIGSNAFSLHQSDMSHWGTTQQLVSLTGTYSQSGGTAITVSVAAHGLTSGFRVLLRFTTGANGDVTYHDDNWFVVTVIDANTFTIQSPVSAIASGNVSVSKIATTTPYSSLTGGCVGIGRDVGNGTSNYRSTGAGDRVGSKGLGIESSGFGYNVFLNYVPGAGSSAFGAYSQQSNNNAGGNTSFGVLTMAGNILTGVSNAAFGPQAMRFVSSGGNNAAFGGNALRGLTTASFNSAFGPDALRFAVGGSLDHNFSNCSGLGYQSYASGDNQVQLGNSSTTTYVFGTVQNRSDARDKAELRPTTLGDEFIDGLEAEEGFWDMRDDYFEEYQVQTGIDLDTAEPTFETRRRLLPKDGSKKRNRRHQWFVAQKVKAICDEIGADFGGFQDHSVNGGSDVMSLGYDEFIPPLTAYVQRRKAELRALEQVVAKQAEVIAAITERLDKLEN